MSTGAMVKSGTVACEANGCTNTLATFSSGDDPDVAVTPVTPGWYVCNAAVKASVSGGRLVVLCPKHGVSLARALPVAEPKP